MMKLLVYVSTILALTITQISAANNLYQWTAPDGTPTFSPDPPPKGVVFTVVGPDLQPIAGNSVLPAPSKAIRIPPVDSPTASNSASNRTGTTSGNTPELAGSIVLTPAPSATGQAATVPVPTNNVPVPVNPVPVNPGKAVTKWKPVQYADDPNPEFNQPVFSTQAAPIEAPVEAAPVSSVCLDIHEEVLMLESLFANAETAQAMDEAVVNLNRYRKSKKGQCGL